MRSGSLVVMKVVIVWDIAHEICCGSSICLFLRGLQVGEDEDKGSDCHDPVGVTGIKNKSLYMLIYSAIALSEQRRG